MRLARHSQGALGNVLGQVADALDAITSQRPYRAARRWDEAAAEIVGERGRQFDPDVVDAFLQRERSLSEIRGELTAA